MPAKRRPPARRNRAPARAATPRQPKPRTVTPYLAVPGGVEALAWYKEAFGAKEYSRQLTPDGKVMHAAFTIGDSAVFLSDVFPGSDIQAPTTIGGTGVNLHIHVKSPDKLWARAVAAGAKVVLPLADQFWGARYGKLTDPFGHSWAVSYPVKMSAERKQALQAEAMRQMGNQP